MNGNTDAGERLRLRVAARLGELWGGPVDVGGVARLSGGASRETWSLDATLPDGTSHGLIVRRDPEHLPRPEQMAREAAAFTAARAAGVPEPELYDHGPVTGGEPDGPGAGPPGGPDGPALGSPYLLMERLEGETIARRLLRDDAYAGARPKLAYAFGTVLARIHAIDPGVIPGLDRVDALPQLLALYEDFGEPRPALELGLRWLREHRPAPSGDTLVHGDFRTGNLLIGPDGLRGVLDWELAHRGDPMQDLGWLCTKAWRFGSPHPVGGFGPREELLAGYAAAGGTPPDAETLAWWELYGTIRWALLCRRQAERHLSGAEPSLELAVLGRRVCEQEHDVLLALGITEPTTVTDPLAETPATQRGVGGADTAANEETRAGAPRPGPPAIAGGTSGGRRDGTDATRSPGGSGRAPHDLPGADGLLAVVGDFLTTEMAAGGDARLRFHARVAANAVKIARREALLASGHAAAHRARLAALGCAGDSALAAAIRDGALDDRWDEVTAAVRADITDKLLVANPAHLAIPG